MALISFMINDEHQQILLSAAEQSIRHGLKGEGVLNVEASSFPEPLQEILASFVTLEKAGDLRGCIGMLKASHPLIQDVVNNAHSAAFRDHRFPAVEATEVDALHLHISVLSVPEPLSFDGEADLVRTITPGRDGLILTDGVHRGTFLPSVWEKVPDPRTFIRHLKQKAGLPQDYWSDSICIERYSTQGFGRDIA